MENNFELTGFTLNFNGNGNAIPRKPRRSVGSKSHVASGPSISVHQTNQMIGFTLNFNGSGNAIPRKPRGSVGSKNHVASGPSISVDQTNQMTSDSKYGGIDKPSIPQLAKKKTRHRYNHKEKINPRKRRHFSEVTDAEEPLCFGVDDLPSIPQHAKKKRKPLNIDKESSVDQAANLNSNCKYPWCSGPDTASKTPRRRYNHKEKVNPRKRRRVYEVIDAENPLHFGADDKLIDKSGKDSTTSETDAEIIRALLALSSSAATSRSGVEAQKTFLPKPIVYNRKRFPKRKVYKSGKDSSTSETKAEIVGALLALSSSSATSRSGVDAQKTILPKPIVFCRKRFPKRKGVSVADSFSASYKQDGIFPINYDGMFKEFLFQLSLPLRSILEFPSGSYISRFSCRSLLLQYGAMVIRWPRVYFEMIFVDNKAGLRSFLLEGCLKLVLAFVFVVLAVVCDANEQRESVGLEIPVTSVRFKLTCAQDHSKQHVFSFYSFSKLNNRLFKEVARRKSLQEIVPNGLSRFGKETRRQHPSYLVKHGMLPFTLCFSAAPLFFRGLHLKLLLQSSIACVRLRQHYCLISQIELDKSNVTGKSLGVQRASGYNSALNDDIVFNSNTIGHDNFLTRNTSNWISSPLVDDSPVSHGERTNVVNSGFGNGPRKPQTQVHYDSPSGSSKFRSRHNPHRYNGHPNRKIRRACEKRTSDDSKGFQRNLELLACKSNVLITIKDRCWREFGARVAVELADQNEWRLTVKFSGSTKYSHKVDHVFQSGSTNRYTRAMMWKGGKDWALEFPDRIQWMLFKEMHEECYSRNICAASVKNIPIPGVRLLEKCEDNTENPFTRSSRYLRKVESDIDMAMNPSKILYDMDSEDEQWILRNEKSLQTQTTSCRVITDDLFEKTMDLLEKFAYAQQRDHFSVAEIEKFMAGVVPSEVIDFIYQHWQQKRKRIGRPLIRHLQPPSWETYERKMQEWHQLMTQVNYTAACGGNMKAPPVEKPAMFAFCLKPLGLEVPRKGLKRRSKKKIHLAGHRHALIGDQDGIIAFEKGSNSFTFRDEKATFPDCSPRLFSLNNDASDFYNHPKLFKNKSKEISLQLGVQALDEFSVREVSCAAKDACKIARIKRERAERLFFKAEIAIHVAHSALMTANAVKAASFQVIDESR